MDIRNLTLSSIKSFYKDIKTSRLQAEMLSRLESAYSNYQEPSPIFILASPRTGSTLFYQMMIKYFSLDYFSNFIDHNFSKYPLIGAQLQKEFAGFSIEDDNERFINSYGTTNGDMGPSEATKVFANWFFHSHPSEIESAHFISDEAKNHMVKTIGNLYGLTQKHLVSKNAWNCFRVEGLMEAFPQARFIWLRRDIISSSYSTLLARMKSGDPTVVWNSCSPRNMQEIKKLPYWEQVVEQQIWTNQRVNESLDNPKILSLEIWYEDLIFDPKKTMDKVSRFIQEDIHIDYIQQNTNMFQKVRKYDDRDYLKIRQYCEANYAKLCR